MIIKIRCDLLDCTNLNTRAHYFLSKVSLSFNSFESNVKISENFIFIIIPKQMWYNFLLVFLSHWIFIFALNHSSTHYSLCCCRFFSLTRSQIFFAIFHNQQSKKSFSLNQYYSERQSICLQKQISEYRSINFSSREEKKNIESFFFRCTIKA